MTKSQLILVGVLALFLESCSILPWFSSTDEEAEMVEPANISETSESEVEANEVVIEPKPIAPPSTPGLIPPTNPARQQQAIAKGRQDPFDAIAVQPIVTVKPPENPPQEDSAPPKPDPNAAKPAQSSSSKPVAAKPPPMTEPLPSLAELARKVVVMGVIEVGGITQVILKAPNEASSRYVQPGQYVADGNVLVKEVERYSELPVVVLEQDGIKVFKSVGEGTESLPEPDETAATVSSIGKD